MVKYYYGKVLLTNISAGKIILAECDNTASTTPVDAGLYIGADHMGYYNASVWKTYMDNSGGFYLGGATGSFQWDGSYLDVNARKITLNTTDALEIQAAGNILVKTGGDINLEATSGDGSTSDINWKCHNRTYTLRGGYEQQCLSLISDTDREGHIYIGYDIDTTTFKRPNSVYINSGAAIVLEIYEAVSGNRSGMTFIADSTNEYIYINCAKFYPYVNNTTTLGYAGKSFLDTFSYILTLPEVAATPTAVTNYGKIYTKSDNALYFCDGDGTVYTLDKTLV